MTALLLSIFCLLFSVLAWKRLNWAILFIVAALPTYLVRFHLGPIPMTLLEGMVLIVVTVWFIQWHGSRCAPLARTISRYDSIQIILRAKSRSQLTIPLLLFLVASTISLFVAPDLRAAAGVWKAYFVEPILFLFILLDLMHNPLQLPLTLRGRDRDVTPLKIRGGRGSYESGISPPQIITAFSITALAVSVYAIIQRFTGLGIPPPWDAELRVTSIFSYPNALALFLGPLIPLFVARFTTAFRHSERSEESRTHVRKLLVIGYWLLVTITSIVAIVFAKSTGAIVGLGAGLLMMILLHLSSRGSEATVAISHYSKRLPHPAVAGLAMTIVVIGLLIFSIPRVRNELLLRDWSGHVRRTQWTETIEMLKDRPLLGTGLAGYKETLAPYHKATYLEIFEYPHNIVLNFWSETGLLGLLAFAWLVVVFFRAAIPPLTLRGGRGSYEPITLGAVAAMSTLLIHGLVDVPYFKNDLAMLFWIIFALGLTNAQKSENIRS